MRRWLRRDEFTTRPSVGGALGGGPLTAPPQSAGHSDDELLFSGMVSRWLFRKGARWVERFDVDLTADREEPEFINGAFGEQTLVDVFKFRAAAKLGPAIIYARALPHPDTGFDVSDFFAGNLEVEKQLSSDRIDLSGETAMDGGDFWAFVSSIGEPKTREDFDRLIERTAAGGDELIFAFQNALALKLFSLDHPANAIKTASTFDQDEPGLCLRCATVLTGKQAFDDLLENPGSVAWESSMRQSGFLLGLAPAAHGYLHRRMSPTLNAAHSTETGSNLTLWGDLVASAPPTSDNVVDTLATPEELSAFYANYFLESWGGVKDRVWDGAAAGGAQWMIARAIVMRGKDTAEVLVWLASWHTEPGSIRTQRILDFLADTGELVVQAALIETVDTHSYRPFGSMPDMFRIARRSRLTQEEYVRKYVGFSSNRAPGWV